MALSEDERNQLICGTTEKVEPPIIVTAGPLSAEIENGNIRYIRWKGFEVLRAISFIIRDTKWGTYKPALTNIRSSAGKDSFRFSYDGACGGVEGSFAYHAEIEGHADGRLLFSARGSSKDGFSTNRTGFVVLHGLGGVTGRSVEVEHASGERSQAAFPDLVDPNQPIFDIRALTHAPQPDLTVSVRMTGDAFEMEDQRNWTDASYKTYVRPLSRGFPYRIGKGEVLEQAVELKVVDRRPNVSAIRSESRRIEIGAASGTMPEIGLALGRGDLDHLSASGLLVQPNYYVLRLDVREPIDKDQLRALATMKVPVDLDVVIDGRNPDLELSPLAASLVQTGFLPRRILVVPARDLRSRPANHLPDGEAGYPAIVATARRLFSGMAIGGGTVVGFPEFNRNRPPNGVDFIAHSTQAIVHAADDRSVMETLEVLPHVIRTARASAPDAAYRLGPGTIGAPAEFYAAPPAANPSNIRMPTAEFDPRQRGLFAAAFALGYAATAAASNIGSVTLAALSGGAEILDRNTRRPYPIGMILDALSKLAGRPRLVPSIAGSGFAAIGAATEEKNTLWLANLTATPIDVDVAGRAFREIEVFDADTLANGTTVEPWFGGPVRLDSYALARLQSSEGGISTSLSAARPGFGQATA